MSLLKQLPSLVLSINKKRIIFYQVQSDVVTLEMLEREALVIVLS